MKEIPVRKIVLTALLSAAALISFLIESLFPPLFIAGARLGISNVFVLFAVICLGVYEGFIVISVKILLGSVFSGNVSAIIYGLPAGLIALLVQVVLLIRLKRVSITAVSAVGGTLNLAIQNAVFCIIAGKEYFAYLPYLTAIGALSGAFVGFTVYLLVKRVPIKFIGTQTQSEKTKETEN